VTVATGFDGTADDLDGAVVEQHHKVVCDVCGWNGKVVQIQMGVDHVSILGKPSQTYITRPRPFGLILLP
jgi:hypothetical protein